MNFISVLLTTLMLTMAGSCCNYVKFKRHIEKNIGDSHTFNAQGNVTKLYYLSLNDLVNYLDQEINSKKTSNLENFQINNISLSVSRNNENTASYLSNIKGELVGRGNSASSTLFKIDTNHVFTGITNVIKLNAALKLAAVTTLGSTIQDAILKKNLNAISLNIMFTVPPSQKLVADISFACTISMDVTTCELVPFGLGPSECMIKTIPFSISPGILK